MQTMQTANCKLQTMQTMQTNHSNMISGAFVLKMKTLHWRMCVVKQVPAERASCWMLFGQNRMDRTTFQIEFQSHQETTLINHITNMAETDEIELRLVLVSDAPAVSCIESLWPLEGQEMYRKKLHTASALINSLHQDVHMLCISPKGNRNEGNRNEGNRQQPSPQNQTKSRHHMQTRSQTR